MPLLLKTYQACVQFTAAGNRNNNDGALNNVGSNGNYWSSTVSGINARNLNFNSGNANMNNNNRANGNSVRCIKDKSIFEPFLNLYSFIHYSALIVLLTVWNSSSLYCQKINGDFPELAGQHITLTGFEGLSNTLIAAVRADADGRFKLAYSKKDIGMGYLTAEDKKAHFVVLSGEDIELQGAFFGVPQSITCSLGNEQQAFIRYSEEHPRREQALSAWGYLERIYAYDSLFVTSEDARTAIAVETARIKSEDRAFLEKLPAKSYVRWYLPVRKLVSSVSNIAQYRPDEIPATIAAFRKLDYSDHRLYKSGLLKEAIESHYWLLENSGRNLDSVVVEMNTSTDLLLASLEHDEVKFNEVTDYLFDLLERHSLFTASEYLALKALTQGSCTLNNDLANQLETYRAMKEGNTAADFAFTGEWLRYGSLDGNLPEKLSDLNTAHKLIVFGASWCPKCTEDIPQIAELYPKWQKQNVEVVFIALDEDKQDFQNFVSDFPFLSHCDYQKWDGTIVQDYYVFATPTMFLLDESNKIVLRPNSVRQVDAWVDWYLAGKRD